jgi:hypothetical protein
MIRLVSDFPVWILPFLMLGALLVTVYLFIRAKGYRKILVLLRAVVFISLILLLWNPALRWETRKERKARIGMWLDLSYSISSSRLNALADSLRRLDSVEVILRDINTGKTVNPDSVKTVDNFTDLSRIESPFPEADYYWLASDGNINLGRKDLPPPKYPLNVIGLGDTLQLSDFKIIDVIYPEKMFAGTPDSVVAFLQISDFDAPQRARLTMQSGKRIIFRKDVMLSPHADRKIKIPLKFKKRGKKYLKLKITGNAKDINPYNNIYGFSLQVLPEKKKVVIVAGYPVPEIHYLKYFLSERKDIAYSLFWGKEISGALSRLKKFPDLIVTFAYPHKILDANEVKFWEEARRKKIPLWFNSHEGLRVEEAARLGLPLKPEHSGGFEALPIVITDAGVSSELSNPGFRSADELDRYFQLMPPIVRDFRIVPEKKGIILLKSLKDGNDSGLLTRGVSAGRKYCEILGWNTYLLHTSAIGTEGEEYWRSVNISLLEWLLNPVKGRGIYYDLPDTLIQNVKQNELLITVIDELGNRVEDADVMVSISEKNWQFRGAPEKTRSGYRMVFPYLSVGNYNLEVEAKWGEGARLNKSGEFYVKNPGVEKIYTARNEALLRKIATGKYVRAENFNKKYLKYPPVEVKEAKIIRLFPEKWILGLILLVFLFDLYIRKKYQSL